MELSDAWGESGLRAYKSIPFYFSSRNYALLANSHKRIIFDMGKTRKNQVTMSMPDQQINAYLFATESPLEIMEQYNGITGRSPDIPTWSLDPWISRRSMTGWDDPETVQDQMDLMIDHGIHFGVILWEGIRRYFGEYEDPGVADMINYYHGRNMKVICWGRTRHIEDTQANRDRYKYDQMPVKQYFVRKQNGDLLRANRGGEVYNPDSNEDPKVFIDVTNPEAMDWWFKHVYGKYFKDQNGKSDGQLSSR